MLATWLTMTRDCSSLRPRIERSSSGRPDGSRRARNAFGARRWRYSVPTEPMSKARWRPVGSNPELDQNSLSSPHSSRLRLKGETDFDGRCATLWTRLWTGREPGGGAISTFGRPRRPTQGTAIEINLTREFEIEDGLDLDWRIREVEVDCKFSLRDIGGWEIPMEMYVCSDHGTQSASSDRPALLVWLNDDSGEWGSGPLESYRPPASLAPRSAQWPKRVTETTAPRRRCAERGLLALGWWSERPAGQSPTRPAARDS